MDNETRRFSRACPIIGSVLMTNCRTHPFPSRVVVARDLVLLLTLVAEWEPSSCCGSSLGGGGGGGGLASRLTVSTGRFMERGQERREERGLKGELMLCA